MTEPSGKLTEAGAQPTCPPEEGQCRVERHSDRARDTGALCGVHVTAEENGENDLTRASDKFSDDKDDDETKYEYLEFCQDERGLIVRFDTLLPDKLPDAKSRSLISTVSNVTTNDVNNSQRVDSLFDVHSFVNFYDGHSTKARMYELSCNNSKLGKDTTDESDDRKANGAHSIDNGKIRTADCNNKYGDDKEDNARDDNNDDNDYTAADIGGISDDNANDGNTGARSDDDSDDKYDEHNSEVRKADNNSDHAHGTRTETTANMPTQKDNTDFDMKPNNKTNGYDKSTADTDNDAYDDKSKTGYVGDITGGMGDTDNIYDDEDHNWCRCFPFTIHVFRKKRRRANQVSHALDETQATIKQAADNISDPEARNNAKRMVVL